MVLKFNRITERHTALYEPYNRQLVDALDKHEKLENTLRKQCVRSFDRQVKNLVSDVKATDTMKECYAIARYYEAAIDYKLAVQEKDVELQQTLKEKMETAAKEMGALSYAKKEINELLGL